MAQNRRSCLTDYYRCPDELVPQVTPSELPTKQGFFGLGSDTLCYGRCSSGSVRYLNGIAPPDALADLAFRDGVAHLPFDLNEVIDNLRLERYSIAGSKQRPITAHATLRNIYYSVRPYLSDPVRGIIKRIVLHDWRNIRFPRWPVDRTVEDIFNAILLLVLKQSLVPRIPFIWFWPDGATGCISMTHDVETPQGRNACEQLMDIDDSFGIKSSFGVVPEERYAVDRAFLENILARGFELNVQDLNHDGHLFDDREKFERRAKRINHYAAEFQAEGFRAGVLYRNLDWLGDLKISYDMSVPNVAHLDPQRGGCCTVMPYFIGDILELPLTTIQDYTLFDVLRQNSTELWKTQTEMILQKNGLATFLVHPDYLRTPAEHALYRDLLVYLRSVARERNAWIALPRQVNQWCRQRNNMRLVRNGDQWSIEGPGSERARLAYARIVADKVVYEIQPTLAERNISAVPLAMAVVATGD